MQDRADRLEYLDHLVTEHRAGRLSRRDFLIRGSVMGFSAALLAACGSSASGGASHTAANGATAAPTGAGAAPTRGGTLRVATVAPDSTPNPVTMYDAGQIQLVQQIAEYLVWVANDGTLSPVLATHWSPDGDARTWTFVLRPGVMFNDGTPLTSADVVATFKRLLDPKQESAALSTFKGILSSDGVVKSGDGKVVFHLDRPYADFPYLVASTNYNSVILPASYKGDFISHPVGTGPFTLVKFDQSQGATLARNPHYHTRGAPYLNGLQFTYFETPQSRTSALLGASADVAHDVSSANTVSLKGNSSYHVLATKSSSTDMLQLRVDRPPFNDPRVRQAVAYCLNRPAIVEAAFRNYATPANDHVFAPVFPQTVNLAQRTQDYSKAKALLKAAGHADGFTATLTTDNFEAIPQEAQLIQQMLKPAGIDLKLEIESQTAYYGSGNNQPWLVVPVGITNWVGRGTAAQLLDLAFTASAVWNTAHWSDPAFDKLVTSFESTTDVSTRNKLAQQLATIQQQQTPQVIFTWQDTLLFASDKVEGLTSNPSQFLRFTDTWLQT